MTNNQKKIRELPLMQQVFLYSYFLLLVITLVGLTAAAFSLNGITLICMILLLLTLVINIGVAFK